MAHAQKPDFVFGRNRRVHLNRRGHQYSRILAAEVCASAVVMLDTPCSEVVWRVLATHSIRQFPLHFPSFASLCAVTFQQESTLYLLDVLKKIYKFWSFVIRNCIGSSVYWVIVFEHLFMVAGTSIKRLLSTVVQCWENVQDMRPWQKLCSMQMTSLTSSDMWKCQHLI